MYIKLLNFCLGALILFAGYCNCSSVEDYLGVYIGNLSELRHVVSGKVYAVNAKTVYIQNFSYDGVAPALFFYATTKDQPDGRGFRLKDSEYDGLPMRRYKNEGVLLSLPDDITLAEVKYVYVWCEKFKINFGDVPLGDNFIEYPKPQRLAALKGPHGISSDPIIFLDAQSILIPNFFYDGKSPNARFWLTPRGQGLSGLSPNGVPVPDENNSTFPLKKYNGKSIILRLPYDQIDFTLGSFGIWDKDFIASFAHVQIPQLENLPPAVSALKLSPWQECSNCEEQKKAFKISQIPTLTSFETNVNVLEREYMTVTVKVPEETNPQRPKTYYESPVYRLPSQNGDKRVNAIRDTSSQGCLASIQGKLFYLVPYKGAQEL